MTATMSGNGQFVTVEGIDGSGKTTVVNALCADLDGTVQTAEPSGFWTGEQVRRAIAGESETHPWTDFYLFMADRVHHIEQQIKPALADGQTVISDRYADSTMAYQPWALRDHVEHPTLYIKYVMEPWRLWPDLTLYLAIDVDTAMDRLSDAGDSYEDRVFLTEVRDNYEWLADRYSGRFVRIDAEQPPADVAAAAREAISDRL